MAATQTFLDDLPAGLEHGRYVQYSVPDLPFEDHEFDLALCSHFLFTYTDQLSLAFHLATIEEMCRVAREARVFPLLKSYGGPSLHLEPEMDALREHGYQVEIRQVSYEFQRGGNRLLSISG